MAYGGARRGAAPMPKPRPSWMLLALSTAAAGACSTTSAPVAAPSVEAAPVAVAAKAPSTPTVSAAPSTLPMPAGLDAAVMDPTAKPCTDFFRYACGGWLDRTEIPPERGNWSRGFNVIDDQNLNTLRALLETTAAGKPPPGMRYPEAVGNYY